MSLAKLSFESIELFLSSKGLPIGRFEIFPIITVVDVPLLRLSSSDIWHPMELEAIKYQYVANIHIHFSSYKKNDIESVYYKEIDFVKIIITATGLIDRGNRGA